jgi:4-hydroxy-L-threonine phosphate dehydrogenase PdxA
MRPLIALTVGDPAGIGPELVHSALRDPDVAAAMRLVVLGPEGCRPDALGDHAWRVTDGPPEWKKGLAQRDCGLAALAALRAGVQEVAAGAAALVTGPVCKEALHLAGERVEGQTELLTRWAGTGDRAQMVGISGDLRVMLLTRHLPLREALAQVTPELVLDRLHLFDGALRSLGIPSPRLALAGFNPHAGETGVLGSEDGDLLAPAVAAATREGLDVTGPRSADTVFLEGGQGRWDGVLALYHDQAFVPLKLLSAGRGLTWIAGLPYLRLSPMHGTAFDIAGTGRADPTNLLHALQTAAAWTR